MALKIYAGNQLEELARVFCEEIYSGNHSIFEQEKVVVQTKGMELFLRKYIAQNTEIAANIETPFLNRFVSDIMLSALDQAEYRQFCISSEQFSPEVLKWRIFDELLTTPGKYPEAEKYIKDSSYCYQLSVKLAETFDRYIWYHNDMLEEWRQKKGTHWESQLYLALTEKTGPSPDFFFLKFLSGEQQIDRKLLAGHYSLFGVGSMPPVLLELCNALGRETDVHLFYLNPSHEYWGELISQKKELTQNLPPLNNPFFANLGVWGQEFFRNTLELMDGTERDCFISPLSGGKSMLHLVQEDIFNNEIRQTSEKELSSDRSISIHNCHSKRREVEILQDQLLLAIKELKIRPEDIIVMAPDINTYAPIIEAVFSSGKLEKSYNISDRSLVSLSNTAENLERIIRLHSARCTAEEIISIIDSLPVRENFSLDETGLENIKDFIGKAKIRWGENADTRLEFSQTAFNEFSWEEGLDRLLLGYASDAGDSHETPWLPAANIYGDKAEQLGIVCFIVKNIFKWRRFCKSEHTAAEWNNLLNEIIDTMYGKAYSFRKESEFLKRSISAWFKKTESAQLTAAFSVKALLEEMNSFLGGISDKRGYLSGGITFCSLVPMRSIPAKVIAVLGLKAVDFPRSEPHNGLNISTARKKGERSRLLEDRYLFLETLLAARERLLLFYPGQGADDNANASPSAPLADLTAYLEKYFSFKVTQQLRNAHDAEYFSSENPNLYSFSEHFCGIAQNIQSPPEEQIIDYPPAEKIPEVDIYADGDVIEYSISDLARTLSNPLNTYLTHTIGIRKTKLQSHFAEDIEPLDVDLPQDILSQIFSVNSTELLLQNLSQRRELPPGTRGESLFEQKYVSIINSVPEEQRKQLDLSNAEKVVIYIVFGKRFRLTGIINQFSGDLNIASIHKYPGSQSMLEFYLSSLCNSYQTERTSTAEDIAYVGSEVLTLPPLTKQESFDRLLELLNIAEAAKKRPLPLFSKASLTFAQTNSMSEAKKSFSGNSMKEGDIDKPCMQYFFSPDNFDDEDFQDEFSKLARIVYAPWREQL